MPRYKFNARSKLPLPTNGQVDYFDTTTTGFGMRVSSGGTRTWIVMYRYNGIKRRMKIGNYPQMALSDARDLAKAALEAADEGRDPSTERKVTRTRVDTVEDLCGRYIEEYAKIKKRSWKKDEQILKAEVIPLLGRKRITDVKKQDIRDVLAPILERGAPVRANHTLGVLRKMFNWAIDAQDIVMINPAAKIPLPGTVNSRSRYLTDDELCAFWDALDIEELGMHGVTAFQILMITGQREMEVIKMRWADIDLEKGLWTIPADVAKNKLEHVIPLTAYVLAALLNLDDLAQPDDVYVFQNPETKDHYRRVFVEKRIIKIRIAGNLIDVVIHDLRRTMTTYLGLLNVDPAIKKKILNHAKRKKTGDVTEIYDRFEYVDQKREAIAKWEKLLLDIVGDDFYATTPAADEFNSSKVIMLGRKGMVKAA